MVLALLATGCGGRVSSASADTSSGASGPRSGASAGTTSGGSGNFASGGVAGSGSNVSSESGVAYAPCGAGASAAPVSFANDLMPIFQGNCSVGSPATGPNATCHGDSNVSSPFGGVRREYFGPPAPATSSAATLAMIYCGLVSEVSSEDPYMDVVKPGDPTQSFLWYKINGTQGSLDNQTPDQCARGDLGSCGDAMSLSLLSGSSTTLLPQADLDLICNWIVQGAGGGVSTCASQPVHCSVDTDCPGTACGSQVCAWPGGTCTPAGTGPMGQDGTCAGTPTCKCASLGATCGFASPFPFACTFTTPPAGSSGSSNGAASGSIANEGSGSSTGAASGSTTIAGSGSGVAVVSGSTTDAGAPSFADVYNNTGLCSICLPCHAPPEGAGYTNGKLDLSTQDNAYTNLVGVLAAGTACGTSGLSRVVAGNAAQSLLYNKLNAKATGVAAPCGSPEPEGAAPALSPTDMGMIERWINAGANP
jgi:hypothetical protein